MAFDPTFEDTELLAAAAGSNHLWSLLLRSAISGGPARLIASTPPVADAVKSIHGAFPESGASDDPANGEWCTDSRWIRCTNLKPGNASEPRVEYNGLDFMSLEILMRTQGVLP